MQSRGKRISKNQNFEQFFYDFDDEDSFLPPSRTPRRKKQSPKESGGEKSLPPLKTSSKIDQNVIISKLKTLYPTLERYDLIEYADLKYQVRFYKITRCLHHDDVMG